MPALKLFDNINLPSDIKNFNNKQLNQLSNEIREELIETISSTGGHLASNLGVVELTIAIHKSFDCPHDQIVWDVGHQCYTHKLLTGRKESFKTLRQHKGISGFPKPSESEYDAFISGHSSTSISAAFGLAKAKELKNDKSFTIAVIGDGALSGGLAYEALNNAGRSKAKLIIIINDNKMSISKNVGAMARYLAKIRSTPLYFKFKSRVEKIVVKIPLVGTRLEKWIIRAKSVIKNILYNNTIFEDMGFAYLGPVDGHNIQTLCDIFNACKTMKRPIVIHACTIKGKGYQFAEEKPDSFHGISNFDIETGESNNSTKCFSSKFGEYLFDFAKDDDKICAITAAMKEGTGLNKFADIYSNRFFDVGIAEEHAIVFAAGLSKNGMLPVFAVYSSFLQRSYDQIIHDAALQNLKIVLAVDRAGLVGEDGETHQGIFDTVFLNSIPNVTILAPSNFFELKSMLHDALYKYPGVVAVRYPRCNEFNLDEKYSSNNNSAVNEYELYNNNSDTLIVAYGRTFNFSMEAIKTKKINSDILKLNSIKPINENCFKIALKYKKIYFFEESIKTGGIGETFEIKLFENNFTGQFKLIAIDDQFVKQSTVEQALSKYKLDTKGIIDVVSSENHYGK